MALYQIVKNGDPILREKAKEVAEITPNILKLLGNMMDTLRDANGLGLAAPQIGVPKRVIVVEAGDEVLQLINPVILRREGEETDYEGCLSVPGTVGEVTRAAKVLVRALDRDGKTVELERAGLVARVLQHEIDHLEGILYIDKAKNIKPVD